MEPAHRDVHAGAHARTGTADRERAIAERAALVRRGLVLNWVTIGYNSVEAVIALIAGLGAGSVALIGFGIDSAIELTAAVAARWRLRMDRDEDERERIERVTHRIIGVSFLALAAWITWESAESLWRREPPDRSLLGLGILALSVVVMPLLARAKRRVAVGLRSGALRSESVQTSLCAWLSAIALGGVGLNALLGWWWADPVAALAMVPIIAMEGADGVRSA